MFEVWFQKATFVIFSEHCQWRDIQAGYMMHRVKKTQRWHIWDLSEKLSVEADEVASFIEINHHRRLLSPLGFSFSLTENQLPRSHHSTFVSNVCPRGLSGNQTLVSKNSITTVLQCFSLKENCLNTDHYHFSLMFQICILHLWRNVSSRALWSDFGSCAKSVEYISNNLKLCCLSQHKGARWQDLKSINHCLK